MQWQELIHDDLVSNQALDARARDLGLDACVIKDPSTRVVWLRMLATTFEAVIGAVWVDSGADSYDTVYAVMERLGFFNHPMLPVTYCNLSPPMLTNIQTIIGLRCLDPG